MAIAIEELVSALDKLLQPQLFDDYCPNGLQVAGTHRIEKIITGVTASQALIDRAVAERAQAILVHHGFFWKGEDPRVIGMKQRRLKALLQHDINLIAYHLPLDAHPQLGNNAQLAHILDILPEKRLDSDRSVALVNAGELASPLTVNEFVARLAAVLGREPLTISGGDHKIRRVAWCTGAAHNYIDTAISMQVDAYISGEISEPVVHIAREMGIHYFSAGHHATERYGVKALGEYLAEQWPVEVSFVDIDSPV